jgi:hypothetical protein
MSFCFLVSGFMVPKFQGSIVICPTVQLSNCPTVQLSNCRSPTADRRPPTDQNPLKDKNKSEKDLNHFILSNSHIAIGNNLWIIVIFVIAVSKDMLTKDKVIKTIAELPDHFSLDELIDKLIFIEKVQKGLDESLAEKVYSKEEAAKKLSKWLK